MSQKLPVNNFEWIEATSQFDEGFIKNYDEESDEDIFLMLMFNIQKIYIIFTIKSLKSLLLIYMINLNMLFT